MHIPLADTLAVSRLLEQGFCGTALYDETLDFAAAAERAAFLTRCKLRVE